MKRSGITLLVLVITIVVSLIIISISVASVSDLFEKSKISGFTERIKTIEEQVSIYYIENKEVPKYDAQLYDKADILSLIEQKDGSSSDFQEELGLNSDNLATAFYKLDLNKISIDRNYLSDEYYIAIPSLHVYTINSISANNKKYYSLSSKLSSGVIRNQGSNYDENILISQSNGMKIEQRYQSVWSNKLGTTIQTFLNAGEKIYINFNNKDVLLQTQENKENVIYFDSLVSADQNGLNVSTTSASVFDSSDMLLLSSKNVKDKYIKVIKKDSSNNVLSSVNIYYFNFDYAAPSTARLNDSAFLDGDKKKLQLYVNDEQSGIKEVRYEYYSTYDRTDGNLGIKSYYSDDKLTRKYLFYNGKVAKADGTGKVVIEIPKGVSSIKMVIIDNALNISDAIELNTRVSNEIFYSISNVTNNGLDIIFYGDNIPTGSFKYSVDNHNYSADINYMPSRSVSISNIKLNSEVLYIKVKSSNGERFIKLELPKSISKGTNVKDESSAYTPYIPVGFSYIEGKVETGFVIQDMSEDSSTKYNEFVWIPVDNKNVKYNKVEFGIGAIASFQNVFVDNKESFTETSSLEGQIKESVAKYGGFYVARYEASSDTLNNTRSIKNGISISNISYENALNKSNAMYQNKADIKSTLMTASCFDSIMQYLNYSKYNVTTESTYNSLLGNFSGTVIKTGSNNNYVLNNIYDICGNLAEMTTETYKGNVVFRGGSYSSTGVNRVCSVRAYNDTTVQLSTVGFRPIIFIK